MRLERFGEFRVLTLRECAPDAPLADCPQLAYDYWRSEIASQDRHNGDVESFYCLVLSTRRRVTGYYLVSTGTLDTILVHPREVFRPAIVANASAIVLMHNHPSGDPSPSEADIMVTRDLIRAGQLIKIDVLDHVIVGKSDGGRCKAWLSLRELGYF
jgi:DNA repair protein RadC